MKYTHDKTSLAPFIEIKIFPSVSIVFTKDNILCTQSVSALIHAETLKNEKQHEVFTYLKNQAEKHHPSFLEKFSQQKIADSNFSPKKTISATNFRDSGSVIINIPLVPLSIKVHS